MEHAQHRDQHLTYIPKRQVSEKPDNDEELNRVLTYEDGDHYYQAFRKPGYHDSLEDGGRR